VSFVVVVDPHRKPLNPVHAGRARFLLKTGHAAVLRRYPFTIILKESQPDAQVVPLRLKIDPGSNVTGLAVVNDVTGHVLWAGELSHRGQHVKENLDQRRACRRSRRQRHTRYRVSRFLNRRQPEGWLAPSLKSRVDNVLTWVERICRWCPIGAVAMELVRFDLQALVNPEITGVEYQQGTLQGYELREFLLENWHRQCAYCGKTGVPLQIEHLVPKSRGGTSRVTNLTLACEPCNQEKGNRTAEEYGFADLEKQAQKPLRDAAAVNSTRWALYERLKAIGLPIEMGTGGRTKFNRAIRQIPKTHWLDAACVGASTPVVLRWQQLVPLRIGAQGWQRRQMCLMDKWGFPRTTGKGASRAFGFKTGDIVKAVVPSGKAHGTHAGKVAIKASGNFTITTKQRAVPDVPYRYCRRVHQADGYSYQKGERAFLSIP
jgi:5-methylcytosine-specific restriction endonuclease McrA